MRYAFIKYYNDAELCKLLIYLNERIRLATRKQRPWLPELLPLLHEGKLKAEEKIYKLRYKRE
jgi:hypothetical protein